MSTPKPRRKTSRPEPKRTAEPAQEITNEKVELTVETPEPNKEAPQQKLSPKMTVGDDPHVEGNRYAPKLKVGTPTIGRSPEFVTTVGLGNLKVTTIK